MQIARTALGVLRFGDYAIRRFLSDGGLGMAAGLAYAALLAIVPLFTIGLSMLAAFPVFDEVRTDLQQWIFRNFVPDTGIAISDYIASFVENASQATAPGLIALAVTAVLLLNNINGALNTIWRVSEPRPWALRVLLYWSLLTLGPLLVGASLTLSSYAFALVQTVGLTDVTAGVLAATRPLSFLLSLLGFTLFFWVVPNRSVRFRHAVVGGATAAICFEGLKILFGLFLAAVPSYQAVYGALSAVAIFLVWMYLSWTVILLGAEVAAALPEWRATLARSGRAATPGDKLGLALALLARLQEANRQGEQLGFRRLSEALPATPAEIDECLGKMSDGGVVARSAGGRWLLSQDLAHLSLARLLSLLELEVAAGETWRGAAGEAVRDLAESLAPRLDASVEAVLESASARAGERQREDIRAV